MFRDDATTILHIYNHLNHPLYMPLYFLFSWIFYLIQPVGYLVAPNATKPVKPNVVLIFMDDMGYGDPGCYGGGPYRTPNMDRLATEGTRFTNFYAAQAVCSASRAGLLTGCYPTRIGISGAFDHNARLALNPDEETLAELLKKAGYRTGMVGKWHLGHKEPFLPLQNGFDEFLGLPYSNDMWPVYYDGTPWTDTNSYRSTYPPLPMIEDNKVIRTLTTLQDQDQLTKLYTERAVSFIKKNHKTPFFLYLAHAMVHVPLGASPRFKGKSSGGLFGDVMEEVDWSVGEVLKALEDNGIANNTLVIFTSDNGPWLTFGNHAGNTGGLREGKGTHWDGGLKVPCIMRWPDHIPSGHTEYALASTLDILPTLAEWCQAPLPGKPIDGVRLQPLFESGHLSTRADFVYYYDRNNLKAIRNERFKLVFHCQSQTYSHPGATGKDGFPGKYGTQEVSQALYDLYTDPGESRDVQEQFPDITAQLTERAHYYRQTLGDGILGIEGHAVRPAASTGH